MKKEKSFSGSNGMYADYENLTTKIEVENMTLKIANCRGRKPVLRDIEKARGIIAALLTEINPCEGKDALKTCDNLLWLIIHDNQ